MEEHAERRAGARRPGLLILFRKHLYILLAALSLFLAGQTGSAAPSHAAYLRSLSFKCQDDYVFSATNTVFAVDIAYLPPEEIAIYLNSIPNNVELVSIKKVTYIPPASSSQGYGTHVEITVRFASAGDVKLFAADLETKEGFFKIPFQAVHVWANMQILKPELSVSVTPAAGQDHVVRAAVGSHIAYTVRVKYASSVRTISYDIPENAIFIEKKRFMNPEEGSGTSGDFSPAFQDAVSYDWQPLVPGDYNLPAVKLVVQAYNGNLVSLPFPTIKVQVHELETAAAAEQKTGAADRLSPAFSAAFAEKPASRQTGELKGSLEDALQLAGLYDRERASLPFFHAALKERQELEQSLGRDVFPPLPRRPAFIILLLLCAAIFLLTLLSVWRKFFSRAAFFFVITLLFGIFTLIYGIRLSRNYAVSKGGILYPIPESGISRGGELPVASVVQILKRAGDWYYVSFNDTNGWIPADAVILIP